MFVREAFRLPHHLLIEANMKVTMQISITGLGLAALLALGLAGCSNAQSRFAQMSKDDQIKMIKYDQDHPTPQQAAIAAKMRAAMESTRAASASGAKVGPPALPSPTAVR